MIITAIALSALIALTSVSPAGRLDSSHRLPKTPRDGPNQPSALDIADDIELFAKCLKAGLPLGACARAVSNAASETTGSHWVHFARLLEVGVPPQRAVAELGTMSGFAELSQLLKLTNDSGASISKGCRQLAQRIRDTAADEALAKAERAGVYIALPLTGCFLPAFLILGLVPVLVSLGADLLLS